MERSGKTSIPEDVFITPSGGAPEAVYIATFMIGQGLNVIVLLDSDKAGLDAKDKLEKRWLTKYRSNQGKVLLIGDLFNDNDRDLSIEDIFSQDFYLQFVKEVYQKELKLKGCEEIKLVGKDQLVKQVERFFDNYQIKFNKGSVAKRIRSAVSRMSEIDDLPKKTIEKTAKLFEKVKEFFPDS